MNDAGPRFGAASWVNWTGRGELRDAALAAETAGWDRLPDLRAALRTARE